MIIPRKKKSLLFCFSHYIIFLPALLVISFFSGSLAFCQDFSEHVREEFPAHKNFTPIAEQNSQNFIDVLFSGKVFQMEKPSVDNAVEKQFFDVWAGNFPELNTQNNIVELLFEKTEAQEGTENSLKFPITLKFEKESFVIKHGLSNFNKQAGGIKVPFDINQKPRYFYYRGKRNTSFVVMVPRFSATEEARGVMLCPRDFSDQGLREEKSLLRGSDVELTRVSVDAVADARGVVRHPDQMARARAAIITSPFISPSNPYEDISYAKNAYASLSYRADKKASSEDLNGKVSINAGIEAVLDLQMPTGFRKISTKDSNLYIKKVDLERTFNVVVPVDETIGAPIYSEIMERRANSYEDKKSQVSVKVMAGSCYIVLRSSDSIVNKYSKESFIPKQN